MSDEKGLLQPTASDLKLLGMAVDLASSVQILVTSVRALAETSDLDQEAKKALMELVDSAQTHNSSIFADINDFIEQPGLAGNDPSGTQQQRFLEASR